MKQKSRRNDHRQTSVDMLSMDRGSHVNTWVFQKHNPLYRPFKILERNIKRNKFLQQNELHQKEGTRLKPQIYAVTIQKLHVLSKTVRT